MLPKANRLRSNREFQRVYRSGRSWAHPLVALHAAAAPEGQRTGISVSKKVGEAVQRNRVRRRLREVLRAQLPGWRQGCEVILVARAASAEATFQELGAAVAELARRARLPREPAPEPDALYSVPSGGRLPRGQSAGANRGAARP